MQLAKSLQKKKYNCQKYATVARLFFNFRGKVLKARFLLSKQEKASKSRLLQCKNSVKIALHTKIEKKMLTKM